MTHFRAAETSLQEVLPEHSLAVTYGASHHTARGLTMSAEKTKALVRRLLDEMNNRGNIAIIDELVAPDFFEHEAPPPGIPRDREGVKTDFTMYHSAFSAIQATIDDMIAVDTKVVSFMTVRATHTGEFAGIPPTGKQVDV